MLRFELCDRVIAPLATAPAGAVSEAGCVGRLKKLCQLLVVVITVKKSNVTVLATALLAMNACCVCVEFLLELL